MTGYADLVTAATVGLNQRPLAIDELAEPVSGQVHVLAGDPAAALLDAAALFDAARRAGGLAPVPAAPPAAAASDSAPELPRTAAAIVGYLLQAGRTSLLADLLAAAADAGFRAPAPLLPQLLAAARGTLPDTVVTRVLGERGRWLAGLLPDAQAFAARAREAPPADVWATGRLAQRRDWLAGLRRSDPDAARELLAAGWARETGDDRAVLIAVLGAGLAGADEPFLEAALDDRRAAVRRQAQALLARLPESAFAARVARRAQAALRIERRMGRRRIVAIPPGEFDAVAVRDGLDPRPPAGRIGAGAWRLTQVVAAAPLAVWSQHLGAEPATLVRLPVSDDYLIDVHAGWRLATVAQHDSEWAAALLDAGDEVEGRPAGAWPGRADLVAVLSRPEREARVVALLGSARTADEGLADVLLCPPPWGPALSRAVLGLLDTAVRPRAALLDLAGRALPLDAAAELRRLAELSPHAAGALTRCAETVDLRRRFYRSLEESQ